MGLLLVLLVPAGMAIFALYRYPKQVVWWEFLLTMLVSLVAGFGARLLVVSGLESDREYRTCYVASAFHTEQYSTTHLRAHKIGKTTVWTPYTVVHPEHWEILGRDGSNVSVDAATYSRLSSRWGGGTTSGHTTQVNWPGDAASAEFMTTAASYENCLLVQHEVQHYPGVTEEQIANFQLFQYPDTSSSYSCNLILGDGGLNQEAAELKLKTLNASYGSEQQFHCWILLFRNQPEKAGELQEALWQGGNRHELVVAIGVDQSDRTTWVHPFSFTPNQELLGAIDDHIKIESKLDLVETVEFLQELLPGNWQPRNTSEPNFLKVALPWWGHLIVALIVVVVGFLSLTWAVSNDITSEPVRYRRR